MPNLFTYIYALPELTVFQSGVERPVKTANHDTSFMNRGAHDFNLDQWKSQCQKYPVAEEHYQAFKNFVIEREYMPDFANGESIPTERVEVKRIETINESGGISMEPFAFLTEPKEERNEAVEFAEWIYTNCHEKGNDFHYYFYEDENETTYSVKELYKIFKSSQ